MEQAVHMTYDGLRTLRKTDFTWRLLTSDNADFVSSFLYTAFVAEHLREITESALVEQLEAFMDYHDVDKSRSAKEYLTIWADNSHFLLRRFNSSDANGNLVVHYDLTPYAVKAIDILLALPGQSYVSTESRLVTVFHLLEEIALKSSDNGALRIASLEAQKREIDAEIARIQQGELSVLSDLQIKDRFQQAMEVSRQIISDFREVEDNFRKLNREMREKISVWEEGKGAFLDQYFAQEQSIEESEQGRSFDAFLGFLFSMDQRRNFYDMLSQIVSLPAVQELPERTAMLQVEGEWIRGGQRIQEMVAQLSQQLKQYISETYLSEERRINHLIRQVEGLGHELRTQPPKEPLFTVTPPIHGISLPLGRPLFIPPTRLEIKEAPMEAGEMEELSPVLFAQRSIDRLQLARNINSYFPHHSQVTLAQIVSDHPPTQGIGELLTYLEIAHQNDVTEDSGVFFGLWQDEQETVRRAKLPNLIFHKEVPTYG